MTPKVKTSIYSKKNKFSDALSIYKKELHSFVTSPKHLVLMKKGGPLDNDYPSLMYQILCRSLPCICQRKNRSWIDKCKEEYSTNHERNDWINESQSYSLFFAFIAKHVEEKQLEREEKEMDDLDFDDFIRVPYDRQTCGIFVKFLDEALKR